MPQQNLTEGTRVFKHYGKIRHCYEITKDVVRELKYTKLNEFFDFSIKITVSMQRCPVWPECGSACANGSADL